MTAAVGILIILLAVPFFNQHSCLISLVYAADSSNNDIEYVEIHQWDGDSWDLIENFTSSGGSCRVHDSYPTNFTVGISLNASLVEDSTEAIAYSRVNMTIANGGTIWDKEELTNLECSLIGDFYYLVEQKSWSVEGQPVAGVTYTCTVDYDAYF